MDKSNSINLVEKKTEEKELIEEDKNDMTECTNDSTAAIIETSLVKLIPFYFDKFREQIVKVDILEDSVYRYWLGKEEDYEACSPPLLVVDEKNMEISNYGESCGDSHLEVKYHVIKLNDNLIYVFKTINSGYNGMLAKSDFDLLKLENDTLSSVKEIIPINIMSFFNENAAKVVKQLEPIIFIMPTCNTSRRKITLKLNESKIDTVKYDWYNSDKVLQEINNDKDSLKSQVKYLWENVAFTTINLVFNEEGTLQITKMK